MNIVLQIKTIVFSFLYGVFFSIMLGFNYKYIVGSRKLFSFFLSFLFVLVNVLLYFIILKKINFGVFHYYEILFIILGFVFENVLFKFLKCKISRK